MNDLRVSNPPIITLTHGLRSGKFLRRRDEGSHLLDPSGRNAGRWDT